MNTKKFCQIYIRGIKGFFVWETTENIFVGSRVQVRLRNRKKIGIVINISSQKPAFVTQNILEIWDEKFIDAKYIEIAKEISDETFCSLEKIISLMVPEKFFYNKNPEKRDIFLVLNPEKINSDIAEIRGPKQKKTIQILKNNKGIISKNFLREQKIGLTTINTLIEKNFLIEKKDKLKASPFFNQKNIFPKKQKIILTNEQSQAIKKILDSKTPILLFGVTGSGKTEVYKEVAKNFLFSLEGKKENYQMLLLVPEIALTSQLINEFKLLFGDNIAIWHSNLSAGEKIQNFIKIKTGEAKILIGARSAVLIPMKNPKLIILDEEHEWTFKNEFLPKFWTHDVVKKISQKFESKLIFGSATPRLESFLACKKTN